jgi:enamine deaminase RidA (YjgF/YER057c/UK114 family)
MPYRTLFLILATALALPGGAQSSPYDPEARLRELKITLPDPGKPVANYVHTVRSGNLVFLAGHGPCPLQDKHKGKVPRDRSIEEAHASARDTAICMLGSLRKQIGDLRKVKRIVKVLGMVNSTEDFHQQPQVINGCSDLLVSVFGERGRHARSAVGMASLPVNLSVEIEMIVEVE